MKKNQINKNQELQLDIMRILEQDPDISQRKLAKKLGASLGATNFCLSALAEKGWVKFVNFSNSSNKKGYLYLMTPSGVNEKARLTLRFLKKRIEEYNHLHQEINLLRNEVNIANKNNETRLDIGMIDDV